MDLSYLFWGNIAIGLLMAALAIPMIKEKIKPNIWYGFRTKKTLSDEKIWYPANKYSGKVMLRTGVSISLISSILLIIISKTEIASSVSIAVLLVFYFMILFVPIIIMLVLSLLYLKKL